MAKTKIPTKPNILFLKYRSTLFDSKVRQKETLFSAFTKSINRKQSMQQKAFQARDSYEPSALEQRKMNSLFPMKSFGRIGCSNNDTSKNI